MADPNWTPERAAACDRLLTTLTTSPDQAERLAAARELGIVSPPGVEPVQATVIVRCVRTEDNRLWSQIEGVNGPVAQYIFPAGGPETGWVLAAVGGLVSFPLLTDAELAATVAAAKGQQ